MIKLRFRKHLFQTIKTRIGPSMLKALKLNKDLFEIVDFSNKNHLIKINILLYKDYL